MLNHFPLIYFTPSTFFADLNSKWLTYTFASHYAFIFRLAYFVTWLFFVYKGPVINNWGEGVEVWSKNLKSDPRDDEHEMAWPPPPWPWPKISWPIPLHKIPPSKINVHTEAYLSNIDTCTVYCYFLIKYYWNSSWLWTRTGLLYFGTLSKVKLS